MPSGPSDSSYDLTKARAIAARLRSPAAPAAAAPAPAAYVRFSRAQIKLGNEPPSTELERHADLAEELTWSSSMMGSGGWRAMLDWCVSSLDADAAFIVDERGLVIAAAGLLDASSVEETGARLIVTFEQGDQMLRSHGQALSVTVELESGCLVGMRVPVRDDEGALIVGIVGPLPLTHEARRKIAAAFTKKALGL